MIRDYHGHRSVSTTNIYVASSPARFISLELAAGGVLISTGTAEALGSAYLLMRGMI